MALGVPRGAVILETGSRPSSAGTLQEYRRPIPGGMKIRMKSFLPGSDDFRDCTLGFSVRMPGDPATPYFITASHCSDSAFMTDNGPYYQRAEWQPWEFIGTEAWDQPLVQDAVYCRGAPLCRWSEATLVQYNDYHDHFGYLAYPWDLWNGTIGIYDYPVARHIVDDGGGPPFVGMNLFKLGQAGGARGGPVTRWCVDIDHPDFSGVKMLCQGVVKFKGQGGDSGGPVYDIGGVGEEWDPYAAQLYGIVWAGYFTTFPFIEADSMAVSGIGNIRSEYGNFTTY